MSDSTKIKKERSPILEKNIELLSELVSKTRYGSITILIQDGVIIQIDKNEKIRIK